MVAAFSKASRYTPNRSLSALLYPLSMPVPGLVERQACRYFVVHGVLEDNGE